MSNEQDKAQSPPPVPIAENETEAQVLEVFFNDSFQERIKEQMRSTIKRELTQMSDVLRESIRNWVQREKQKFDFEAATQKQIEMQEQIEKLEQQARALNMDQDTARRQMELKTHENKMLLQGIEKLLKNKI